MTRFESLGRKGHRLLSRALLAGALLLPLTACDTDKLVDVEDPASLPPDRLDTEEAVPALINGALRQFVGGYSGFGLDDSFVSSSGVISDELYWGDTFTTRIAADQRNLQPTVLGNISDPSFNRLHQARINARRAYAAIEKFTQNATHKSLMRTIEGYTYVTLSEGWCGYVPFSIVPDTGFVDAKSITPGDPINTRAMNDTAVVRFNEALALSSTNHLAAIGKARALLNNGRHADAAAAVANVPTTYQYLLEHSANLGSQNNPMFSLMSNGRYGVSNLEGGVTATGAAIRPDAASPPTTATGAEGLPFRALRDPRVPWTGRAARNNACFSSLATCWLNNNYSSFNSNVPLATGIEARLIEAEAALQAGDVTGMMTRLNELRSRVAELLRSLYDDQRQTFPAPPAAPTLEPLTDPATPTMSAQEQFNARRDLLFRERALWLFNTGHRQGDLRRLIRTYGVPSNQAFPSGPYFRGGTYGNDVAYPVPFNEQNNRKFEASQCVTTQA